MMYVCLSSGLGEGLVFFLSPPLRFDSPIRLAVTEAGTYGLTAFEDVSTFKALNGFLLIGALDFELIFSVACFWCQSFGDVSPYVCSYNFSSVSVAEWPPLGK